ncbi:IS3 family transposase [Streptomyces sp. NPDC004609]|uniref:IS3 family transposase n=1 Tax=Streptomyces sp. NPDC004609 TaxID=3364704 RepID=UPI0036C1DD3A
MPWLRPSTAPSRLSRSSTKGPWRDADQVERAVVQWVGWYNTERLLSALDHLPPEEFETQRYRTQASTTAA